MTIEEEKKEAERKAGIFADHLSRTQELRNSRAKKSKNQKCPCSTCKEVRSQVGFGLKPEGFYKSGDGKKQYKVLANGMLVRVSNED